MQTYLVEIFSVSSIKWIIQKHAKVFALPHETIDKIEIFYTHSKYI